MKEKLRNIFRPFVVVSLIIFVTVYLIHFATGMSYKFADLINSTLSHWFRRGLAAIGDLFPFSLLEVLIILSPVALAIVIYRAVKAFRTGEGRARFISGIAAIVLLICSGHLLALGVAHNATPLASKMAIKSVEVNEDNLAETLTLLRDEINALADSMPRNEDGVFDPGYSFETISEKVCASYDALAEIYDIVPGFNSRAMGVANGWAMCYLGITGIYSYITGESNVNSYYPAYVTIYTTAHELCHQRGVMRENEANFLAYLITMTSDDPYFRYSGAMNIYNYFASALYRTNKERYKEINSELSPLALADFRESSRVTNLYDDTIIEKISERINDLYLKSRGSDGVVSYGYVVRLVVAYYNQEK